tara:strand:+ start:154 stop:1194 length:1041 start_codon:yes stop_codon:yes gene_type:complete
MPCDHPSRAFCCTQDGLPSNRDIYPKCAFGATIKEECTNVSSIGDRGSDACPSVFLSSYDIWDILHRAFPNDCNHFFANIGARDGVNDDPIWPLWSLHPLRSRFRGMGVEASNIFFPKLIQNFKQIDALSRFKAVNKIITPSTFASTLRETGAPLEMDLLKVDIDRCECALMEELLRDSLYRPKVIFQEVNEFLWPPLGYKTYCTTRTKIHGKGSCVRFGGCSLASAHEIMGRYHYELLQFDWPDGVWVSRKYASAFRSTLTKNVSRMFEVGYNHALMHYARFMPGNQARKTKGSGSIRPRHCYDWYSRRGNPIRALKMVAADLQKNRVDRQPDRERVDVYLTNVY